MASLVNTFTGTTSATLSGIVAGDLLLQFIYSTSPGNSAPGAPSGWTALSQGVSFGSTLSEGASYKVAAGGETTSGAPTSFSGTVTHVVVMQFRPNQPGGTIAARQIGSTTSFNASPVNVSGPGSAKLNDNSRFVIGLISQNSSAGESAAPPTPVNTNVVFSGVDTPAVYGTYISQQAGFTGTFSGSGAASKTITAGVYECMCVEISDTTAAGITQHLAAAAADVATATAGLRVSHHFAASAQAFATSGAALDLQRHLAAAAAALASASAGLRDTKHLAAAVTAVASASAILGVHKSLGASLSDVATGTGALDVQKHLAAAAKAIAAMTVALEGGTGGAFDHLAADAKAQATATIALRDTLHLTAQAATAVATATTALREIKELVAAAQAVTATSDVTLRQRTHLGAQAAAVATGDAALYAAHPVAQPGPTVQNVEVTWQSIVNRADPSQAEANRREVEYAFSRPGRKFYGDGARRGAYN